jgi:hypothetical protein
MPANRAPRVDAAQRDARALELRAAGATYRQIAERLGCSLDTAWKAVDRGLVRTRQEPADKLRRLERERLDAWQVTAERIARTRHVLIQAGKPVIDPSTGRPYADNGPVLAALGMLVRIAERRARLEGLDAPVRVDARVETVAEIDAQIRELEAELEAGDPGWTAQHRREEGAGRLAVAFQRAWADPGRRLGDMPGFIAAALDLAVSVLGLNEQDQEQTAAAVEANLVVRRG